MEWTLVIAAYVIQLIIVTLIQNKEFKRDSHKKQRYDVLPLHYKLACVLGVQPLGFPLVLASFVIFQSPTLALVSVFLFPIAYITLDLASVNFYRKHGLWD